MNNIKTLTATSVRIGYEYLRELCSFNADFNAFNPRLNPITNRVNYICYQLNKMGVPFDIDYFNADNPEELHKDKPKFVNVYAFFKGESPTNETIIFLAHHDVVNLDSENCQDNTASVSNLLHLCGLLKGKTLNKNVLVVFTDAEEKCEFTKCGAKRLAIISKMEMYGKVIKSINLELTANGTELWVNCLTSKKLMYEIQTDYKA